MNDGLFLLTKMNTNNGNFNNLLELRFTNQAFNNRLIYKLSATLIYRKIAYKGRTKIQRVDKSTKKNPIHENIISDFLKLIRISV